MYENQYLTDVIEQFMQLKRLADKSLDQLTEQNIHQRIDSNSNCLAILLKHLSGNMRSRWREFLTTDGEKPDRNRDKEFILTMEDTFDALKNRWDMGWECLFSTLKSLDVKDLERTVFIRDEAHRVIQAINRQLTHYAYHVGQIVFLARHFKGSSWKYMSIAPGKSEEFNRLKRKNPRSG